MEWYEKCFKKQHLEMAEEYYERARQALLDKDYKGDNHNAFK